MFNIERLSEFSIHFLEYSSVSTEKFYGITLDYFGAQTERLKSLRVHSQNVETLYSLNVLKIIEKVKFDVISLCLRLDYSLTERRSI